jgi:hypothetical protein
MNNLIQDTLNKIKKEHIAPEPRWKFLLRKSGIWLLVSLAVFFGATAISIVYFLLSQLDWDLYRFMHKNSIMYFFSIVPYFWIIFLGIIVIGAFFGVRKTETGYRLSWLKIIFVISLIVIIIGFIISAIGLDRHLNNAMIAEVPFYAQNIATMEKQWMQPEQGFLAGTISTVSNDEIILKDLDTLTWNVHLDEKTLVRPTVSLEQGQMIKIIGNEDGEQKFSATEIRPWVGQRAKGLKQGGGRMNGR